MPAFVMETLRPDQFSILIDNVHFAKISKFHFCYFFNMLSMQLSNE